MARNVTIKDIARQLSIAPSTVSRSLNNNPEISKDTRERVWALAKELNYTPNPIALSLRHQKTNSIGVILPEIVHFFFSTVISGIEEVAYENGYTVIVSQSNENLDHEILNSKALFNHRVDGLLACISCQTEKMDHFQALIDKGVPVVFFDRDVTDIDASSVLVDDFQGAYDATKHLIDAGKKRIVHISGPSKMLISQRRIAGFKQALLDGGHTADDSNIIFCQRGDFEEVALLFQTFMDSDQPFDGIFASNDMAAMSAMQLLKKASISIPGEVAVVGFSNWQFSEFIDPPLTTVDQPGREMGKQAAKLIIQEIKTKEDEFIEPTKIVLPTKLVVRGSA
jgi:LacI family transcriptional regulator